MNGEFIIIRLLIEITVKGITELKYIDYRKVKKIREIRKKRPEMATPNMLAVVDEYVEYYLYNEKGVSGTNNWYRY